jgi:UV DNA damage endonuclease
MRLGYACICLGINKNRSKKDQIVVNRGMIKKTYDKKGLSYVSELAILNLRDLKKVLQYNVNNNILLYRMSSDMFPFIGFYKLSDLPNFNVIKDILIDIGSYIKDNDLRVSFHPSHFCVLSSQNKDVIKNTVDELNKHAEIMDLMGLDKNTYYPINIHIGSTKPDRISSSVRFCENFNLLTESCKSRFTVENDDSPNKFSTKMLYDLVYTKIGIPIVFDQHHFNYGTQDQDMKSALELALSTWKTKAITHMSSPKTHEDKSAKKIAHADYIYEKIESFGYDFDVDIEAKAKDLALIKYINDYQQ